MNVPARRLKLCCRAVRNLVNDGSHAYRLNGNPHTVDGREHMVEVYLGTTQPFVFSPSGNGAPSAKLKR